ncbi:hypothetical protein ACOME3_001781 [Neoechinorhynchus agilis]
MKLHNLIFSNEIRIRVFLEDDYKAKYAELAKNYTEMTENGNEEMDENMDEIVSQEDYERAIYLEKRIDYLEELKSVKSEAKPNKDTNIKCTHKEENEMQKKLQNERFNEMNERLNKIEESAKQKLQDLLSRRPALLEYINFSEKRVGEIASEIQELPKEIPLKPSEPREMYVSKIRMINDDFSRRQEMIDQQEEIYRRINDEKQKVTIALNAQRQLLSEHRKASDQLEENERTLLELQNYHQIYYPLQRKALKILQTSQFEQQSALSHIKEDKLEKQQKKEKKVFKEKANEHMHLANSGKATEMESILNLVANFYEMSIAEIAEDNETLEHIFKTDSGDLRVQCY